MIIKFKIFESNTIGQISKIKSKDIFEVKFDTFKFNDADWNFDIFDISEIRYWSKNKKELELILLGEKYNI